MALGTVRFLSAARAPREAVIHGGKYEVKIYASEDRKSLRTFYPVFLGRVGSPEFHVRIVAALVNPSGHDPGRESVTLLNAAPDEADLSGYAVRAPNGGTFTIESLTLAAGATERVALPKDVAPLSNKGGDVALLDPAGEVAHQVSYSRSEAKRQGWTVVF